MPQRLDRSRRRAWESNGWLHLQGALSRSTVATLDRWVGEVESWANSDGPGLHHFEQTDDGPTIARSEDFDAHHRSLSALLRGGVIVDVIAELFGEPAALFKEKINYKAPGGGGFAPHQDATAYRFGDHHISCMVPLDSSTLRSGCLHIAPIVDGILPNDGGRIDPDWVDGATWTALECQPGDLVFFDSYTPHHSGTNTSSHRRRAMYLTYNPASAGDQRAAYYAHKEALLAVVGDDGEHVRISVNDDFLGRPVGR